MLKTKSENPHFPCDECDSNQKATLIDGYSRQAHSCTSLNALLFKFMNTTSVYAMNEQRKELYSAQSYEKRQIIEEDMVQQMCCWNFLVNKIHKLMNLTILRDILDTNEWKSTTNFRDREVKIMQSIKWCIKRDDMDTLRVMINYLESVMNENDFNDAITEFVNIASEFGSSECISLLSKHQTDRNEKMWSESIGYEGSDFSTDEDDDDWENVIEID